MVLLLIKDLRGILIVHHLTGARCRPEPETAKNVLDRNIKHPIEKIRFVKQQPYPKKMVWGQTRRERATTSMFYGVASGLWLD